MKQIFVITLLALSVTALAQGEEHMEAGDKLFAKGKYAESIAEFTRAIESDPTNLNAHIQRGMAYSLTRNYEQAAADFDKVLDEKPGLLAVRNSRGSANMKRKKYNEAIDDFNAILAADPENQEAYNNRGWCKKHLGDEEGACADWKKSKKLGNSEAKIIMKNNGC